MTTRWREMWKEAVSQDLAAWGWAQSSPAPASESSSRRPAFWDRPPPRPPRPPRPPALLLQPGSGSRSRRKGCPWCTWIPRKAGAGRRTRCERREGPFPVGSGVSTAGVSHWKHRHGTRTYLWWQLPKVLSKPYSIIQLIYKNFTSGRISSTQWVFVTGNGGGAKVGSGSNVLKRAQTTTPSPSTG